MYHKFDVVHSMEAATLQNGEPGKSPAVFHAEESAVLALT